MKVLQLVHGFPPDEQAGTEVYAARLAAGLQKLGLDVYTVAATRQIGRPQYQLIESLKLTRIVQNMPYLGLQTGERDPVIEQILGQLEARFKPDLVHIQHPMFLGSGFRARVPMIWTLHDAWGWCAAGGRLVREDGTLCSGPSKACASCAGSQAQEPVFAARAVQVAAKLPWDASRLHRLYQRLPARLKSRIPSECNTVSAAQIQARQKNLLSLAKACSALVSPSRFLALLAEQHGFPKPVIIPHGVTPPTITPKERNYLLFLGTLAPHKGPLLVRDAWKLAGRPLPLRIVGPSGPDLLYLSKLQAEEPMPEPAVKNVWELLAGARALVLGSCWPENAPLVVLEAQSVGCPVVAPEIGGIPELLSEGWLYPPKNKEALAEAILKACTEQKQPDPPWSFERHLETILGLYARVAKR